MDATVEVAYHDKEDQFQVSVMVNDGGVERCLTTRFIDRGEEPWWTLFTDEGMQAWRDRG